MMTYDELLAKIDAQFGGIGYSPKTNALRAVVELCDKWETKGSYCLPVDDVIQAIEKKLQ